jgi:hypothetical protein
MVKIMSGCGSEATGIKNKERKNMLNDLIVSSNIDSIFLRTLFSIPLNQLLIYNIYNLIYFSVLI